MRHVLLTAVLGVAAVTLSSHPAPGQVVQLRTGEVLVGKVEAHEDGLTVARTDNGGVLDLRWEQLSESSAKSLKTLFSLAADDEGEFMVSAELVRYELPGGGVEEVVGVTNPNWDNDTTITVRRQGVNFPIRRQAVRRRTTVERPALDVFTRDEFYNERLSFYEPGDDADRHVLLADDLTRVRDYDRAALHLEQARDLGGGRQPEAIDGRIKRLKLFREAAAERQALDEIRIALARDNYAKGLELIEAFEQKYKRSKLQAEFTRTVQRFQRSRERYLVSRITEFWYKQAYSLARTKVNQAGTSFDAAREYAESEMGQDIRRAVQQRLGIDAEEVDTLWAKRFDYRGGPRPQQFSYGVGSWMLGSAAIIKGTKQEKSGANREEESEREKQQRRTAERIQRARERARRAASSQRGGGADSGEATPEQWWEEATSDQRLVWLRAYYAEHGGDLTLVSASLSNCGYCGGFGKETIVGDSGKVQKVDCPTCHGTQFKRTIRAR